jgi:hypothetical protein
MNTSDGTTDGTFQELHSTIDVLTAYLADKDAEIKRLKIGEEHWTAIAKLNNQLRADNEQLRKAIRSTATEGTYDESAIRKAVSFELAELIVEARTTFINMVPPKEGGVDA